MAIWEQRLGLKPLCSPINKLKPLGALVIIYKIAFASKHNQRCVWDCNWEYKCAVTEYSSPLSIKCKSSAAYPPLLLQTECVWRKPEIGVTSPKSPAEDVKRWKVWVVGVSLLRASSPRQLVARQRHKGYVRRCKEESVHLILRKELNFCQDIYIFSFSCWCLILILKAVHNLPCWLLCFNCGTILTPPINFFPSAINLCKNQISRVFQILWRKLPWVRLLCHGFLQCTCSFSYTVKHVLLKCNSGNIMQLQLHYGNIIFMGWWDFRDSA